MPEGVSIVVAWIAGRYCSTIAIFPFTINKTETESPLKNTKLGKGKPSFFVWALSEINPTFPLLKRSTPRTSISSTSIFYSDFSIFSR